MSAIRIPRPLRDKLGEEASSSLLELLHEVGNSERIHTLEVVEDRFALRVLESEERINKKMEERIGQTNTRIDQLNQKMDDKFDAVNNEFVLLRRDMASTNENNQKQFLDTQKQFTGLEGKLGDIQKQITVQTRWIIASFGFFALLLRLLNLIQ